MYTVINRQCSDAVGAHLIDKRRQRGTVGQQRKSIVSIHPQDRRGLIDNRRECLGGYLAGQQRTHAAKYPIQTMRGAAVAFTGRHILRDGIGMFGTETVAAQCAQC
ncbi:hypothetical protein D3C78_1749590 [compost metagenome]